jgi:hypothetical protein
MAHTRSTRGLRAAQVAAGLMIAVAVVEAPVYGGAELQQAMTHPLWLPATTAALAALGLLMWALPALADAQGSALGRWGRRGAAAAVVGLFLNSGLLYTHTFVTPVLAADHPSAYAAFYGPDIPPVGLLVAFLLGRVGQHAGLVVFGVASWRAGTVPRAAAVLVVLGGALGLLTFAAGLSIGVAGVINVVPLVGLAMMASALRRQDEVPAAVTVPRPSTVS